MRYVLYATGLLALAGMTSACSHAESLRRSSSMTNAQENTVSDLSQDMRSHKGTKMKTERFIVGDEMHYGYFLIPEHVEGRKGTLDDMIFPELMTQQVITAFEAFFAASNDKSTIGKTPYCDCVGEHYKTEGGMKKFRIYEAHLFAE